MYFIDGGYLRRQLIDITGTDGFAIQSLPYKLNNKFFGGRIHGEIIRVYYYDAICDHSEPRYKEQRKLFDKINVTEFYEEFDKKLVLNEIETKKLFKEN